MYDYSTTMDLTNSSDLATDAIAGVFAGMGVVAWIIYIAIAIFEIVAMWKLFEKAGKPGWAAIVPVYNLVVMFQIVGMNPWLILLLIVPFVNFVATPVLMILTYVKLAKAFGKGTGYAVGLIFLNAIFMPILAFSDAQYQGVE